MVRVLWKREEGRERGLSLEKWRILGFRVTIILEFGGFFSSISSTFLSLVLCVGMKMELWWQFCYLVFLKMMRYF